MCHHKNHKNIHNLWFFTRDFRVFEQVPEHSTQAIDLTFKPQKKSEILACCHEECGEAVINRRSCHDMERQAVILRADKLSLGALRQLSVGAEPCYHLYWTGFRALRQTVNGRLQQAVTWLLLGVYKLSLDDELSKRTWITVKLLRCTEASRLSEIAARGAI